LPVSYFVIITLCWNFKNPLHLRTCGCAWFFLDSPQEYGIRGFPTIKVFAPGKPPVDYQGARDVKPIAEFALQQVRWNLASVIFNLFPPSLM